MTTADGYRCHECPDDTRAVRGCPKLRDPALAIPGRQPWCPVLEVEPWYWLALEDHLLLSRGHLTLDDVTWGRYTLAYDVAYQRDAIARARAEAEVRRGKNRNQSDGQR